MKRARSTLFGHLVLGMVAVSLIAIGVTSAFLFLRFEQMNNNFREGTLRSFAQRLALDVKGSADRHVLSFSPLTMRSLRLANGKFAIVSQTEGVISASDGVAAEFIPVDGAAERYFVLPGVKEADAVYGLSLRIAGMPGPTYVQVAFPNNHVVFDSVLEEFIVDIGWIWFPFMLIILATNVIVVRILLRPLKQVVEQAEAIGPGSTSMRLAEGRLPRDILILVRSMNLALERLDAGYRGLEEFFGDVAHELRTPLAVIKAQLDVSDAPVAQVLKNDFSHIERLVQQLLDRVRLGGLRFEPDDVFDLNEVARDTAGFLAPLIVKHHRSVEVVGVEAPVYVNGARDYVFRALRNLIENALEFTPPHTTITVAVGADRSIAVLDRGPGFTAEKLDPLLRRQHEFSSGRPEGIGLGLSIAERTMLAHRGHLDLLNRSDGGALARMCFPVQGLSLAGAV